MIARFNRLSLLWGVPGILIQIGGYIAGNVAGASSASQSPPAITRLVVLLGTVLLIIGLAYYAKAKGRHPAWCLMGFLSIIGLIVLACLKDKAPGEK